MHGRWIVAGAVALVVVAALGWFLRGGDGDDTSGFFTPSTPAPCDESEPVYLDEARFAAFSGSLTATGEDQLLVVTMLPASAASQPDSFSLAEPSARYEAQPGGAANTLVFRVPRPSGAFKLSYDGPCGLQEWIVP